METQMRKQVNQAVHVEKTPLPKYIHPPKTKHELDYADLVTLDMSEFDRPGGKERLAGQLKETAHRVGFFYIVNFGLSQAEVDQQFAIAKEFFALPEEERMKYRAALETGNYNGYRPLRSLEFYNIFKFIPQTQRSQPELF